MRHSRWTLRDGAPGNIRALAEGRDGFLWLGTSTGLYRFDGLRFERIVPERDDPRRSLQVTALLAAANGDIWVGYDFGGIGVFRGGRLHDANPWPPEGGVTTLAQSRDGAIWVAAESRGKLVLSRLQNGRWARFGAAQGLSEKLTDGLMGPLLAEADGSVLLALPPNLLRLAPGGSRFERLPEPVGSYAALAQDAQGRIWLADDRGMRVPGSKAVGNLAPLDRVGTPYVTRHLLVDSLGGAWITGQDKGLAHFRPGQATSPQTAGQAQDLSSTLTLSALADREGNVWIGTQTGLDRFSPAGLVAAGGEAPVTGLVSPVGSDMVFFAGLKGVYRASRASPMPQLILPRADIGVLCGDARQLLAISLDGAVLLDLDDQGNVRRQTPVAGPLSVSCARDSQGTFWTGMDRLYRLAGTRLVAAEGPAGKPGGTITMLRSDGKCGLIAAQSRHGLLYIRAGAERLFLPTGSLAIGSVTTLTQVGPTLWIGGQKGLARLARDGTSAVLTERTYPFLAGLTGIYRTGDGWTWLNGATGIVRLRSDVLDSALDHALVRPSRPLEVQRLGREADFSARANLFDASDIAQSASGWLWFATNRGLAWSDPAHLTRNPVVPPVVIRTLRADGVLQPLDGASLRLPAHTRRVQIEFTALSLTDAPANRFRYRLEGTSGDWFDAGAERQTLFTDLGPGAYEFQVLAANNDGVWNRQGAVVRFTIAPAYYQTGWFLALCLTLVCGGLWLAYRRRLHVVAERARSRVEAQLGERERIARELHDTLLQGFQGLMLRFQAVVELLPRGDRARQALESTLDRAEDVLVESRERVHSLREELHPVLLAPRLAHLAGETLGDALPWQIDEQGSVREVCAPVADEIGRIVREALSNALRHARARRMELRILHGPDKVTICVIDDGQGLPAPVRETGRREGHYGMVGMRERARRLSGTLEVVSPPQGGTEIRLSVPARIAYQ